MKHLMNAILFALATILVMPVFAHGDAKPKHGGVLVAASDLSFELVSTADGATLYVEDHGKTLATANMTGKLAVLTGANKTEADLKPAGDNKLNVTGLKLVSGAKAVATINAVGKKPLTVRFVIR